MPELESPCTCRWPWRSRPERPGPAYGVAPVEATHQAWVTPVVCSGPSSTPCPGSRLFWSSVYSKRKAGTIKSTARTVATSTAVIVSGRRCRLVYRQRFGPVVVPLGNSPPEDERSRSDYSRYTPPAMRLAPKQHERAEIHARPGTAQTTVLEAVRPRHLVTRTDAHLGLQLDLISELTSEGEGTLLELRARTEWPRGRALLGKLIEVVILNPSEARRELARLKTLVERV
jgi:hypothetical protein